MANEAAACGMRETNPAGTFAANNWCAKAPTHQAAHATLIQLRSLSVSISESRSTRVSQKRPVKSYYIKITSTPADTRGPEKERRASAQ